MSNIHNLKAPRRTNEARERGRKDGVKKTPEDRDAVFSAILALISEGNSVRSACREKGVPLMTFLDNVDGVHYARAREAQADYHFDAMLDLENDVLSGKLDPQAFRAAMDARKWRLARMKPRAYGDRVDHVSTDGTMTPTPAANLDFSHLTPQELIELTRAAFDGK